jgi:hypothetical protein
MNGPLLKSRGEMNRATLLRHLLAFSLYEYHDFGEERSMLNISSSFPRKAVQILSMGWNHLTV